MDISKTYIKMCDCPELHAKKDHQGGKQISHYIGLSGDFKVHVSKYGDYWALGKDLTWLPRQDQIQELMGATSLGQMETILMDFAEVNSTKYVYSFDSLEKQWLAFYMSWEHSKTWDGEKWVKK